MKVLFTANGLVSGHGLKAIVEFYNSGQSKAEFYFDDNHFRLIEDKNGKPIGFYSTGGGELQELIAFFHKIGEYRDKNELFGQGFEEWIDKFEGKKL